ncbi:MAG: bifunctional (p)ppGpp synthetase/guanosine-3',5'-bis(diphosphate) 3'-pyrophosphohydrolase [Chloroflexi bacterium]|nr:bifunctional (p)ppGpp synthetase/guanosine-3',5'-bis(diphosphate) 3'-pyrophosphohydrolase [Chloroflexota bacterium]
MSFETLIDSMTNLSAHERKMMKRAYELAQSAHDGQKRKSGEDYFVHCYEVARIIINLGLDHEVVCAALLHDVVEDTPFTLEELRAEFGDTIANLVAGVTKIDQVPLNTDNVPAGKPRDREAQFLRKTLLAINDDVRVILIKLADRLHNMRTLGYLSEERQRRMARETMEVFAPLASRLGIWQMKWELEDLSFRYLNPTRYRQIAKMIDERRADRDYYVNQIADRVRAALRENGIEAEVTGRSKHIYSIHRKMERKRLPFDQIFDVRAVRVLVDDVPTCYQVLGIIHQMWRPIKDEFDDYIAAPKDNFYQSLHTAVLLEGGKTLEVQIRTHEMHAHAEYGVAAHWLYKEGKKGQDHAFERRVKHLRELMDIGRTVDDPDEFMEVMRSDVFRDRVYVFTPRGDIIDLPNGATPIDFAYHIHTDVGDRCRGAKANGKLVPLDYVLQVGDRVEVLTAKRGGPSRDWLNPNLGYVKTKRALSKIRHWFRQQDREKMIHLGRDVLDRELSRLGVEQEMSHEQVAGLFDLSREDLLAKIGFGDIHPQHVTTKVMEFEQQRKQVDDKTERMLNGMKAPAAPKKDPSDVKIQGVGGMLVNLAKCCNPVQGDDIIGYITVGRGVSVHRRDCGNVLNLPGHRLITVAWGGDEKETYPVPIMLSAYDREGLMRDISAAVADEHINLSDLRVTTRGNIATFYFTMLVGDAVQLNRIMTRFEQMPNVREARRLTN